MASTPPDESWQRLGRALIARRLDLNPKYKSREVFARDTDMDYRVLFDIENARRTNFGAMTIARIERAYELQNGAIEKFRINPDLTEFPDRTGSASSQLTPGDVAGLYAGPDARLSDIPGGINPDPVKGEMSLAGMTQLPEWWRVEMIMLLRNLTYPDNRGEQLRDARERNGTEG